MRTTALLALLLLFFLNFPALAGDEEIKKYGSYTPEQIRELPESVREKSVPMKFTIAAQRGLAIDAKIAFSMDLNTLMYPAISEYDVAVKSFQSDLGEKPSGVLSVNQIWELQKRAETQKLGVVAFPSTYSNFYSADTAKIEGTYKILDEKIAWPINHVKVDCYRTESYCESRQIVLLLPRDNDWAQAYQVMDTGVDLYKIMLSSRCNT